MLSGLFDSPALVVAVCAGRRRLHIFVRISPIVQVNGINSTLTPHRGTDPPRLG
jgi:hypothetical protein